MVLCGLIQDEKRICLGGYEDKATLDSTTSHNMTMCVRRSGCSWYAFGLLFQRRALITLADPRQPGMPKDAPALHFAGAEFPQRQNGREEKRTFSTDFTRGSRLGPLVLGRDYT